MSKQTRRKLEAAAALLEAEPDGSDPATIHPPDDQQRPAGGIASYVACSLRAQTYLRTQGNGNAQTKPTPGWVVLVWCPSNQRHNGCISQGIWLPGDLPMNTG